MKTLIAVLTLVVALLAIALWKRDASARTSSATADAALAAVSNQLAEASMKVTHQEQLATVARAGLGERVRELAAMSNTVTTLHSDLDRTRVEAVAAAEAQSAGLTSKLEELTVIHRSAAAGIGAPRLLKGLPNWHGGGCRVPAVEFRLAAYGGLCYGSVTNQEMAPVQAVTPELL